MSKQNHQTGPTSSTGKLISSMNHFKHGATSKTLFLTSDDPNEYLTLLEGAFAQYKPASATDAALVAQYVTDHWILARRQNALNLFEAALYERKPESTYWVAVDLNELHLLERYKTESARSLTRSLKNLQTMQRMNRDEKLWPEQLAMEKQRLAVHVERHAIAKAREARLQAKSSAKEETKQPHHEPTPPTESTTHIEQTLYIGYEDGETTHFETTPTNTQLRRRLTPASQILRTYNFVGGVPPTHEHLITSDCYQCGPNTSVSHLFTYEEWSSLVVNE